MREVEHEYLVSVVSQVDAEGAHAMEDKFHGGQEVIEHCRLPKSTEVKFNHRIKGTIELFEASSLILYCN